MELLTLSLQPDRVNAQLNGDLNFNTARDLHSQLLRLFHTHHHIRIEIGTLGSLDLAGIQILYAAYASARTLGLKFQFDPGSARERIDRLLDFAGLPPLKEGADGL